MSGLEQKSPEATQAKKKAQIKSKPFVESSSSTLSTTKRKLETETTSKPSQDQQSAKKMKFNKQKNFKKPDKKPATNEISENRLKAFGINPKKYNNKIKYNGKNNQTSQDGNKKSFTKKKF